MRVYTKVVKNRHNTRFCYAVHIMIFVNENGNTNPMVLRVGPFQQSPGVVKPFVTELAGQPRRTLRQERDQKKRRDGGEHEEYYVDGLPSEQRTDGSGEQHARGKEYAVQRQQHLSVRGVRYFRDVNHDHGRHACES